MYLEVLFIHCLGDIVRSNGVNLKYYNTRRKPTVSLVSSATIIAANYKPVLKAFEESELAGQRKLPAAPGITTKIGWHLRLCGSITSCETIGFIQGREEGGGGREG